VSKEESVALPYEDSPVPNVELDAYRDFDEVPNVEEFVLW
jgi:hypothetical protein